MGCCGGQRGVGRGGPGRRWDREDGFQGSMMWKDGGTNGRRSERRVE